MRGHEEVLQKFRTGFPEYTWFMYKDSKLNMRAIMRIDADNVNEMMPHPYRGHPVKRYRLLRSFNPKTIKTDIS